MTLSEPKIFVSCRRELKSSSGSGKEGMEGDKPGMFHMQGGKITSLLPGKLDFHGLNLGESHIISLLD